MNVNFLQVDTRRQRRYNGAEFDARMLLELARLLLLAGHVSRAAD